MLVEGIGCFLKISGLELSKFEDIDESLHAVLLKHGEILMQNSPQKLQQ